MPRTPLLPTDAELQVLRQLWTHGPGTVREVHEALYGDDAGYTTTLKLLQNLLAKALVAREERGRQHVYRAAVEEGATMAAVTRRLIERSFGGSAAELAMRALGAKAASREELRELKRLIQELERREGRRGEAP